MDPINIMYAILLLVIGIPNAIIDHKHRRRNAYPHGNAWAYYSKLSKEGSWEGKFMMWSGYVGIAAILSILALAFYQLLTLK
jgi:hypothetical protein